MSTASAKPKLNVHSFPRPPLLEETPRRLVIKWNNDTVVDTIDGYWVLETTHPPTYYIPPSAITKNFRLDVIPNRSSHCEWKGSATYWKLTHMANRDAQNAATANKRSDQLWSVSAKVWSYESPTSGFQDIKGYLSFYASDVPWECYVDGEKVTPQDGDFYGGWVTGELEGRMKGGPGTWGW